MCCLCLSRTDSKDQDYLVSDSSMFMFRSMSSVLPNSLCWLSLALWLCNTEENSKQLGCVNMWTTCMNISSILW